LLFSASSTIESTDREKKKQQRTSKNCRRAMEPSSAAAAAAGPRPPTFASQTNALLRKNLIFQVNPYGILLSCSFSFEVAP